MTCALRFSVYVTMATASQTMRPANAAKRRAGEHAGTFQESGHATGVIVGARRSGHRVVVGAHEDGGELRLATRYGGDQIAPLKLSLCERVDAHGEPSLLKGGGDVACRDRVPVGAVDGVAVTPAQVGDMGPQPFGVDALNQPPNVQWCGHEVAAPRRWRWG